MQIFPVGKIYDFMRVSRWCIGFSTLITFGSIVLLFWPGPRLGTDFIGGTEVEVLFEKPVSPEAVKDAVQAAGFSRPDVIRVKEASAKSRFLIRVQEVSTVAEGVQHDIEKRLCFGEAKPAGCEHHASEVKFSPGGEKITVRYEEAPDLAWISAQMQGASEVTLKPGKNNPTVQDVRDHRVEIALTSRGDQLMEGLRAGLAKGSVPDAALRTEWVGPKAGAQLRDSALKSIIIALFFITAYVAFRFDFRFAPGGVLALIHDALATVGILIVLGREINLTTVAAILTIIGYSINDTVVVYDRVRENIGRLRGTTFHDLINISISEMLGRTILTGGTTIMALTCFFIWGTGALQDFALTLVIGVVLGVYSSIYVALPLTAYLDRSLFSGRKSRA